MNRNQTCHSTTLKNAEYSPRSSHVYPSRGIRAMQRDSAQNVSIKDHPLCAEVLRTYMYVLHFLGHVFTHLKCISYYVDSVCVLVDKSITPLCSPDTPISDL